MKPKIVFLGTPSIGAAALKSLLNSDFFDIIAIVTTLDKKVGRSHSISYPSPVAQIAEKYGIKTIKTNNINQDLSKLEELGHIDVLLTAAFGQLLSDDVLKLANFKALNVHGSLLPEGRGGAPLHWSIIKDKKITGVSIMEMVKDMDAGDHYSQDQIKITPEETYDSLYEKMSNLIEKVTATRIKQIWDGDLQPTKQNKHEVTKWLNITDADAQINFKQYAYEVNNQIRGLNSKPGGYITHKYGKVKVWESRVPKEPIPVPMKVFKEGEVVFIDERGIFVACQTNYIFLIKITLSGKKPAYVKDLINGNIKIQVGDIFNKE